MKTKGQCPVKICFAYVSQTMNFREKCVRYTKVYKNSKKSV